MAIFLPGAALWTLITLKMVISPPSIADICGDENAMCCLSCAKAAWFTFIPFLTFLFVLILFLPGFLILRSIARRAAWWQRVYWIPGWTVAGFVTAVLLTIYLATALNIDNGVLWQSG